MNNNCFNNNFLWYIIYGFVFVCFSHATRIFLLTLIRMYNFLFFVYMCKSYKYVTITTVRVKKCTNDFLPITRIRDFMSSYRLIRCSRVECSIGSAVRWFKPHLIKKKVRLRILIKKNSIHVNWALLERIYYTIYNKHIMYFKKKFTLNNFIF